MGLAVLQDPLNDPTSVRMGGEKVNVASECIDDELNLSCGNTFDGLLHHMVAILITNAFQDVRVEFFDKLSLLISENIFQSLQCVRLV